MSAERLSYLGKLEPEDLLCELLAVMHSDGREHADRVGLAQAVLDAEAAWSARDAALTNAYAEGRKDQAEEAVGVTDALIDAVAHLAGAASAYRMYAKRHVSQGKALADPFFATRIKDFDAAVDRGRAALAGAAQGAEPKPPKAELVQALEAMCREYERAWRSGAHGWAPDWLPHRNAMELVRTASTGTEKQP